MRGGVGFGVFSVAEGEPRVGFRAGDGVLDLAAAGLGAVFEARSLNPFLALGRSAWEDTLTRVDHLITGGAELVPLEQTSAYLPIEWKRSCRVAASSAAGAEWSRHENTRAFSTNAAVSVSSSARSSSAKTAAASRLRKPCSPFERTAW